MPQKYIVPKLLIIRSFLTEKGNQVDLTEAVN